jgi:hypothetical protein
LQRFGSLLTAHSLQPLILFIFLTPVLLFLYSPSLTGGFYFDSKPYLLESHIYQGGLPLSEAISRSVERGYHAAYNRIIPNITMAFQTYQNGAQARPLRSLNVIFHAAAVSLLFLLYGAILKLLFPEWETRTRDFCAMGGAVLWGLNPFQVETVAYMVQRSVIITGALFFLAMYIFIVIASRPGTSNSYLLWTLLTFVLIGGTLSKENSILFPLTATAIYLYLPRTHFSLSIKKAIVTMFGVGLLMLAIILVVRGPTPSPMSSYTARSFTAVERLLTESRVVVHQFSLFLFPAPWRLSLASYYPLSRSLFSPPTTILSILTILGSLAAAWRWRRCFPVAGIAVIWYLSNHLLESTFLPLEISFPHRNYLPTAMIFLVPVVALIKYQGTQRYSWIRTATPVLIVIIALTFSILTYRSSVLWGNETRFWQHNIAVSPGSTLPYLSFSGYLLEKNRPESALTVINRGLKRGDFKNDAPKRKASMLVNRGIAFSRTGKIKEGISSIRQALEITPENLAYQYNLSALLIQSYRWQEAEPILVNIIKSDPTYPEAHMQLARIYEHDKRYQQAIALLEIELRLFPNNRTARILHGRITERLGP